MYTVIFYRNEFSDVGDYKAQFCDTIQEVVAYIDREFWSYWDRYEVRVILSDGQEVVLP